MAEPSQLAESTYPQPDEQYLAAVERAAEALAEADASTAFDPLRDDPAGQEAREAYRSLARTALEAAHHPGLRRALRFIQAMERQARRHAAETDAELAEQEAVMQRLRADLADLQARWQRHLVDCPRPRPLPAVLRDIPAELRPTSGDLWFERAPEAGSGC